jgi:hypothetical protein
MALSTGMALVTIGGFKNHEKIPFGQLSFLGGILFYCGYVVDAYGKAPWLYSIGLGLAVFMLASVLEKKHQLIVKAVGSYLNELKEWGVRVFFYSLGFLRRPYGKDLVVIALIIPCNFNHLYR